MKHIVKKAFLNLHDSYRYDQYATKLTRRAYRNRTAMTCTKLTRTAITY